MATTNAKTALNAGKVAGKPAPKPEVAKAAAPQAPRYTMGPWPVKAQGGNSIRAYCYSVAKALAKDKGAAGFTAAEYAAALAKAQEGSTYKQPSAGWGTEAKPNGNAHSHANWFAHPKQGWLSPAAGK